MKTINRRRLFIASCFALTVTSMTFAIRAGMLGDLGKQFGLDSTQIGYIASTAFWGFPLAVIIGGMLTDIIGMKKLMIVAFLSHILGIVLTIYSGGFWTLFFSTLLIGIANGLVEAACNPLVATLYPDNKTKKLNHFHIWFPGGLVIGGLIVHLFKGQSWGWELQMATMILPALIYGYIFFTSKLPVTERVEKGVSDQEMYSAMFKPLFIFMVICMFGTAITELGTNQWIEVLLKNATDNSILLLVFVGSIMAVGRGFAGPIVQQFSPPGVLFVSAILSALGLYLMSISSGMNLFAATAVFAVGVTYFWPTMLGFVAEYTPNTGAVGLGIIGGAGMFATSIFLPIIGSVYDSQLALALPDGADIAMYKDALPDTAQAIEFGKAQVKAGPYILRNMTIFPIILTVAFGALFFMRGKLPKRGVAGH